MVAGALRERAREREESVRMSSFVFSFVEFWCLSRA
jgi:hypothetical protein